MALEIRITRKGHDFYKIVAQGKDTVERTYVAERDIIERALLDEIDELEITPGLGA